MSDSSAPGSSEPDSTVAFGDVAPGSTSGMRWESEAPARAGGRHPRRGGGRRGVGRSARSRPRTRRAFDSCWDIGNDVDPYVHMREGHLPSGDHTVNLT